MLGVVHSLSRLLRLLLRRLDSFFLARPSTGWRGNPSRCYVSSHLAVPTFTLRWLKSSTWSDVLDSAVCLSFTIGLPFAGAGSDEILTGGFVNTFFPNVRSHVERFK